MNKFTQAYHSNPQDNIEKLLKELVAAVSSNKNEAPMEEIAKAIMAIADKKTEVNIKADHSNSDQALKQVSVYLKKAHEEFLRAHVSVVDNIKNIDPPNINFNPVIEMPEKPKEKAPQSYKFSITRDGHGRASEIIATPIG